jgi:hypothetical protein
MKKSAFTLLILLSGSIGFCQNQIKIDSLKKVFAITNQD